MRWIGLGRRGSLKVESAPVTKPIETSTAAAEPGADLAREAALKTAGVVPTQATPPPALSTPP